VVRRPWAWDGPSVVTDANAVRAGREQKALAVTGRQADGWIPGHAADWPSPRCRDSHPIIDEAAAAAGRDCFSDMG
jgi:alkanesulfonate monooxygenase SsuD/methylene tetrahydromethanopterin reductase-like flavin-dependent oxidoreductase (luciferase family)